MDNTSSDFLARFPEEAITMTINKKRIEGFLRANRVDSEKFSSLTPEAAEFIVKLNNLGFVTFEYIERQKTLLSVMEKIEANFKVSMIPK